MKYGENLSVFNDNAEKLKIPKDIVELFTKKSEILNKNRRELLMEGTREFTTSYWLKVGKAEGKAEGKVEGKAEGKFEKGIFSAILLITKYKATVDQAISDLQLPPETKDTIITILKEKNFDYCQDK